MGTILGWLQLLFVVLFLATLLGGPMALVDWLRKRRAETVLQQIALTDAIYARYGSIASPVVRRPLWGPRQIEFQAAPGAAAKVLAAAHEVLSAADGMNLGQYQIVLTSMQEPAPVDGRPPARQSTKRWHGDTIVATR